ncbi:MAG: RluA family pseudouridine synthase [Bacteroidota bacterium]
MPKSKRQVHRIKSVASNTRLTDYAARIFPVLGSRTAVKKAIVAGTLLLNDEQIEEGALVKKGDLLVLKIKVAKRPKFKVDINLPIVFEDDYLLVVNKPAGIAVNGNRNKTVENAVATLVQPSRQADALPHPVAVHRIDVPTKGLVLLAKTKSALIQLSKAFQHNEVKKMYWAVVHGKTLTTAQIDQPIQGKKAVTRFETTKTVPSRIFQHLSLLQLFPVTGRTHQLRIHLKNEGHLIVGDKQYAEGQKTILGKGLFLCAGRLQFTHPVTKEWMDIRLEVPRRFAKLLEREKVRFGKENPRKKRR